MENDFWINLASSDLDKARSFYEKLGFKINEMHGNPGMVSLFVGNKGVVLNLFPASALQSFASHSISNTAQSIESLFSLGASSRSEVDALAERAVAAGGSLYAQPGEKDGWMYGCGFVDPDGHRWSVLYMDMSKMPKQR